MPFCSNCGAKLNEGAKFCHNCGSKVIMSTAPVTPTEPIQPAPQPIQPAPQPVRPEGAPTHRQVSPAEQSQAAAAKTGLGVPTHRPATPNNPVNRAASTSSKPSGSGSTSGGSNAGKVVGIIVAVLLIVAAVLIFLSSRGIKLENKNLFKGSKGKQTEQVFGAKGSFTGGKMPSINDLKKGSKQASGKKPAKQATAKAATQASSGSPAERQPGNQVDQQLDFQRSGLQEFEGNWHSIGTWVTEYGSVKDRSDKDNADDIDRYMTTTDKVGFVFRDGQVEVQVGAKITLSGPYTATGDGKGYVIDQDGDKRITWMYSPSKDIHYIYIHFLSDDGIGMASCAKFKRV